jgi:hypothetical protein
LKRFFIDFEKKSKPTETSDMLWQTVCYLFGKILNEYAPDCADEWWRAGVLSDEQVVCFHHRCQRDCLYAYTTDHPDTVQDTTNLSKTRRWRQWHRLQQLELNFASPGLWIFNKPLHTLIVTKTAFVLDVRWLEDMPLRTLHAYDLSLPDHHKSSFERLPLTDLRLERCSLPWSSFRGLIHLQTLCISTFGPLQERTQSLDVVQNMTRLKTLILQTLDFNDFTPLVGKPLQTLHLYCYEGYDTLDKLRGLPLTDLQLDDWFRGSSLGALKNMKLRRLCIDNMYRCIDLSPLSGMPLTELKLNSFAHGDLTPLASCTCIHDLELNAYEGTNLEPLRLLPLQYISLNRYQGDVSALKDIQKRNPKLLAYVQYIFLK